MDNNKRLLGWIPSRIQAAKAHAARELSDEDRIAKLAAPWDKTEQPSIVKWGDDWRQHLEELATAYDLLRDFKKLPPVWDIAKFYGYDLESLCDTTQRTNDCTAWGTRRAATCLALYQRWIGTETRVDKLNPMGYYCYSSGYSPQAGQYVPDNGRTIYAIAEAACKYGGFTVDDIGEYNGQAAYTAAMIKSEANAKLRQTGWVYLGEGYSASQLADIIILSLRACKPAIIGNMVALQDGTSVNSDGVPVSQVGGGWGGGHCTAACDIKKVGNNYYPWIYNSHGNRYTTNTNAPAGGTYITRDGLINYLSGSYADVMLTTYTESPRVDAVTDINPGAARA